MSRLQRRIERAEEALGIGQEPMVVNITWFGDGPVPPEQQREDRILRYVAYTDVYGDLAKREGCLGNREQIRQYL